MQTLIAMLIGSGLTVGAKWVVDFLNGKKVLKYGEILSKAYDIIDPLLERNMRGWDGAKVDLALEMAIDSVADGQLTPDEVKELAIEAGKNWLPNVAAEKVRKFEKLLIEPVQLKAAEIIAKAIDRSENVDQAVGQVKIALTQT